MNAVCEIAHIAHAKFDEPGRQRALDRLNVLETPVEEPFERIVDLVKTTFGAPICAVSLIDNDRQWLKAFRGMEVDQTPRSIAFCDHAIRADAPLVVEDATRDPRFADNPLVTGNPFIRSYLGCPLKMPDGYIVGTLCVVDRKPRGFSDSEIAILRSFADLVVGELELRTIAFSDGLTKLMSRRAWHQGMEREIDRAGRYGLDLTLLMLDIDHFKQVNDRYGHDIGDVVLRRIAAVIRAGLRQHDLGGRLGGEELAISLVNTSEVAAREVAERIRTEIAALEFDGLPDLACTTSIGLAQLRPGETIDTLMKRADSALYEAKDRGRNQVRSG